MKLLIAITVSLTSLTLADSAMQNDWSGGPGVMGPVTYFSNVFFQQENVNYLDSSYVNLEPGEKHKVTYTPFHAKAIYFADYDQDGDVDITASTGGGGWARWYKNLDGSGISWNSYNLPISSHAKSLYSADVNGDSFPDILLADPVYDDIVWVENVDASTNIWQTHIIDTVYNGASSVHCGDINGDGYLDILGAAEYANDIAWWENAGGSGTNWIKHIVDADFSGANSIHSADINGDGYLDILGSALNEGKISWWRNVDGSGTDWIETVIDYDFDGVRAVYSADVNGDGYNDVISVASNDDEIAWWENIDGSGSSFSWEKHVIDDSFDGAWSVFPADLNEDGNIDVLGSAYSGNEISWWENADGAGASWVKHCLVSDYDMPMSVCAADVDGDSNIDAIGSTYEGDEIAWWDLHSYSPSGILESSILSVGIDPYWQWLNWTCTVSPSTGVYFQVRASDDFMEMGAWSDTLFSPCSLEGIIEDGKSYVQYKAILLTTDPDTTPALLDVTISWDPTGIHETSEPLDTDLALLPVTPNPSSDRVSLRFTTPGDISIDLRVFDVSGRLVAEKPSQEYCAGLHAVEFGELPPGVYFLRMVADGELTERRFVVVE